LIKSNGFNKIKYTLICSILDEISRTATVPESPQDGVENLNIVKTAQEFVCTNDTRSTPFGNLASASCVTIILHYNAEPPLHLPTLQHADFV